MNIPTSFKLGGSTWRVRLVKMRHAYGETDFAKHTIRIASYLDGEETSEETRLKTFLHEWFHAFQYTIGIDTTEELAVLFENMAYQTLKTSKGANYV